MRSVNGLEPHTSTSAEVMSGTSLAQGGARGSTGMWAAAIAHE